MFKKFLFKKILITIKVRLCIFEFITIKMLLYFNVDFITLYCYLGVIKTNLSVFKNVLGFKKFLFIDKKPTNFIA